jgi:hypothetical protein
LASQNEKIPKLELLFLRVCICDCFEHAQAPVAMLPKPVFEQSRASIVQAGKVDEAIAQYRQGLVLRPDFPEALSNLGLALDAKGNDAEAKRIDPTLAAPN